VSLARRLRGGAGAGAAARAQILTDLSCALCRSGKASFLVYSGRRSRRDLWPVRELRHVEKPITVTLLARLAALEQHRQRYRQASSRQQQARASRCVPSTLAPGHGQSCVDLVGAHAGRRAARPIPTSSPWPLPTIPPPALAASCATCSARLAAAPAQAARPSCINRRHCRRCGRRRSSGLRVVQAGSDIHSPARKVQEVPALRPE
jgi:hypothetical protein